ncbi:hypothetical protein [Candidatus Palauibacter sp.]
MTAMKTVLGFLIGVALYTLVDRATGPEWTESIDTLTAGWSIGNA